LPSAASAEARGQAIARMRRARLRKLRMMHPCLALAQAIRARVDVRLDLSRPFVRFVSNNLIESVS
jgi:hypothetical protein